MSAPPQSAAIYGKHLAFLAKKQDQSEAAYVGSEAAMSSRKWKLAYLDSPAWEPAPIFGR